MKDILQNIKYLDVFPEDTGFVKDGKKQYRSYLGVVLSLVLISASMVVAFMFGQEVYKREHPIVSLSEEYIGISEVDIKKWPIFVILTDGQGNKLDNKDDQYFSLPIGKMNFTADGNVDRLGPPPGINFVRCTIEDFKYSLQYINRSEIDKKLEDPSYCLRVDEEAEAVFRNPYKAPNSQFIILMFDLCNPEERKCADDLDMVTEEFYVQMNFLNTYINYNDFADPVKYYFDSINQQLTTTILKRNYVKVVEELFSRDDGWLIEDIKEIKYYSFVSVTTEINKISENWPNSRLWITLEAPFLRTKSIRSYMKVQDLFAKIGGIVNAFMIIIQIMFAHYLRYNFIMKLRQYLNPTKNNNSEKIDLNIKEENFNNNSNNLIKDNQAHIMKNSNIAEEAKNQNDLSNARIFNKESIVNIIKDNNSFLKNKNNEIYANTLSPNKFKYNNFIERTTNKNTKNEVNYEKQHQNFVNEINSITKVEKTDANFYKFEHLDFSKLNYFNYIKAILFCQKAKREKYFLIRDQIDELFDIYNFASFLKNEYSKQNPNSFNL